MRLYFSDLSRIKKQAKSNVKSGLAGLKKWWIKKYKLPPNHDLFLNQNEGDLNLEMVEDWLLRKNELEALLTNKASMFPHEQLRDMQKELDSINAALGEEAEVVDDLIDKWEKELLEGKIPDLNEGLNRG